MKKYFRFIRKNIDKIYQAFLFLLVVVVITLLFPNIGYFRYEFQKGKPWMHETLIAPFDFAIYKTDKELAQERDSILKNYKPYFTYNQQAFERVKDKLTTNFNTNWNKFSTSSEFKSLQLKQKESIKLKENTYQKILELIQGIYQKGIINVPPELEQKDKKPVTAIVSLRNNIAEEHHLQDLYTAKSAYQYLVREIDVRPSSKPLKPFIQQLNLNAYLSPNLVYDPDMSEKVKKSMVEDISLTRGMVQANERIVFEGDIIDNDTYRILESIKREYESVLGSSQSHYLIVLGQVLLISVCLLILFLFLGNFRNKILKDYKKLIFILMMVVLFMAISTFAIKVNFINIYLIPFALITIIVRTFMDSRTALFTLLITVLMVGFLAPNSFEFLFLQLAAGVTAIFSLARLERRGQLILTAFLIFLTYSLIYFAFAVTQEGSIKEIEWQNFVWFAGNGLLLTFSYPLMYIFEKLFGFLSDVTLMELSQSNHPLLRKLTQNSPGTFQHSLQVANLAEKAIYEIGGNPLLVRTGALYHDIGKMKHPIYFIENQSSIENPHNKLEFDKSAQIITDHVKYGVEIARKHKIPQQIVDFIRTHHGEGKVQYFYRSFKNKYPDKEIDEEKFTYPGPDPFTKETAVLMMADSVEAASRSLKEKTSLTIQTLVSDIIDRQVAEKRFDNADITFKNIRQIKEIFTHELINVYHARIEYPKETCEE
jgi:putative nucleotidyltransferase with HDIG domain